MYCIFIKKFIYKKTLSHDNKVSECIGRCLTVLTLCSTLKQGFYFGNLYDYFRYLLITLLNMHAAIYFKKKREKRFFDRFERQNYQTRGREKEEEREIEEKGRKELFSSPGSLPKMI